MGFNKRQIVIIQDDGVWDSRDATTAGLQAASAKFVEEIIAVDISHETEPVGVAKVMIHAAIVGVIGGGLRIRKRNTSYIVSPPRA